MDCTRHQLPQELFVESAEVRNCLWGLMQEDEEQSRQ